MDDAFEALEPVRHEPREQLHRFEHGGKRFAIDPETCFCFECDAISWDVLEYYPHTPVNRIYHLLGKQHDPKELSEVVGEIEWLRASKSILALQKREDMLKPYELERGLKRLCVCVPQASGEVKARRRWFGRSGAENDSDSSLSGDAVSPKRILKSASTLLLARSGSQNDLLLEFLVEGAGHDAEVVSDACMEAMEAARLAGKTLTTCVVLRGLKVLSAPSTLQGHTLSARLEFQNAAEADLRKQVAALLRATTFSLSGLLKVLQPDLPGVSGRVIVCPDNPAFGSVAQAFEEAGFGTIEIDIEGAFVAHPEIDAAAMLGGLEEAAVYYAERLLKNHYFRLDPIAPLFWRIYGGKPQARSDTAGLNELAVDAEGNIYPSRFMLPGAGMPGHEAFKVGSVTSGTIDEDAVRRFEDVGSLTTPACMSCWARNLCGGGTAAVHHAMTGSYRTPHEPWCDAQRAWMAAAVAAFQRLSSEGVNFDRIYKSLGKKEKPSLFTLARMFLSSELRSASVAMRPLHEADAPTLVKWENWSEASYFLVNETGIVLGSLYDREMDSVHQRGIEQEFVLTRRNGDVIGLLKMRPDRFASSALAWLYFHDEAEYGSDLTRKGVRFLLREAGKTQSIRFVSVPVSEKEAHLHAFMEAIGFACAGVQREALFLHGTYHDVRIYTCDLSAL